MNFLLMAALVCVTPYYSGSYFGSGPSSPYFSAIDKGYKLYVPPDRPQKPPIRKNRVMITVRSMYNTFYTLGICVKSANGQSLIITDFDTANKGNKYLVDDNYATLVSTNNIFSVLIVDTVYPVVAKNFYKFRVNELKEWPHLGD